MHKIAVLVVLPFLLASGRDFAADRALILGLRAQISADLRATAARLAPELGTTDEEVSIAAYLAMVPMRGGTVQGFLRVKPNHITLRLRAYPQELLSDVTTRLEAVGGVVFVSSDAEISGFENNIHRAPSLYLSKGYRESEFMHNLERVRQWELVFAKQRQALELDEAVGTTSLILATPLATYFLEASAMALVVEGVSIRNTKRLIAAANEPLTRALAKAEEVEALFRQLLGTLRTDLQQVQIEELIATVAAQRVQFAEALAAQTQRYQQMLAAPPVGADNGSTPGACAEYFGR